MKAFEVLHRDAVVQVVGAGREQVFPRRRCLGGDRGIHVGIEEERAEPLQQLRQRFAISEREPRSGRCRRLRCGRERRRRAAEHDLPGGEVVVGTGVQPEQLRVPDDLGAGRRLDAIGMRDDRFEHVAHLEIVRIALVIEDVTAGERRLIQVPDERFVLERQVAEAVRVDLNDRRVADALEQVLSRVGRRRGGSSDVCRINGGIRRSATGHGS